MATSIRRTPLIASRPARTYRLEMERRTLMLLLSLMGLTGIVVFSLGVVTGMGMRVPEGALPVVTQALTPNEGKAPSPGAGSPAFEAGLKSTTPTIEGLETEQALASRQTRSLVERAERVLKLEEVAPKRRQAPAARGNNPPPVKKQVQRPTALSNLPSVTRGQYTVQVFSSQHRQNARALMVKLKKLGFDAYMNQFQGSDRRTWFRVRVGKTSRPEAERLVDRLRSEAKMKTPRIVQL